MTGFAARMEIILSLVTIVVSLLGQFFFVAAGVLETPGLHWFIAHQQPDSLSQNTNLLAPPATHHGVPV